MNNRTLVMMLVAAGLVLLLSMSVYTVHQTERAIVLEFGAVADTDVKPGLHFKVPFMNSVKKFDARVLTVDSQPETYYTLRKSRSSSIPS